MLVTYDSRATFGEGRELEDGFARLPDFHFDITIAVRSSH